MNRLVKATLTFLVLPAVFFFLGNSFVDAAIGNPGTKNGIDNPILYDDLNEFLLAIVDGVVQVGFYLVVIFIIYAGFLFVKARGNEAELKKAKEAFLYTIIGATILLGATVLKNVIVGTINQIESGGTGSTPGDTRPLP